jgi:hypothetical protein
MKSDREREHPAGGVHGGAGSHPTSSVILHDSKQLFYSFKSRNDGHPDHYAELKKRAFRRSSLSDIAYIVKFTDRRRSGVTKIVCGGGNDLGTAAAARFLADRWEQIVVARDSQHPPALTRDFAIAIAVYASSPTEASAVTSYNARDTDVEVLEFLVNDGRTPGSVVCRPTHLLSTKHLDPRWLSWAALKHRLGFHGDADRS